MAQQFKDRAFESCSVLGLADVTFLGSKFGYVTIPLGDSICLIESLISDAPNGEWEVSVGVRTGNVFTRDTVVASSNGGDPVNFTGDSAEIALVASSFFYEKVTADIIQNAINIGLNADDIAQNKLDITANANQISINIAAIAQNASDIGDNAAQIALNIAAINQNASDITGKENSLGNPAVDGYALVSTAAGVRGWVPFPSGGAVAWGDITGNLSDQTDLQAALDDKLDANGTAVDSALLQGQDGAYYLARANHTGLQAPETITFPNVNATDLIDLKHFYDHSWSAGVTDIAGAVVDGGGCTVNVPECEVTFRTSDSEHAPLIAYKMDAVLGLVVGAGNSGNIYADYNAGVPIFKFGLVGNASLNLTTEVPLAVVACDGTNTLILSISKYNTDSTGLLVRRLIDLGLAHAPGGTILGESGTRNISVTAGLFYLSLQGIPNDAFDSSVADNFTYWYKDGAGGWSTLATQTQISNTLYDDGSGTLAPILNNDYSQSWVYIQGSDAGFTVHVLFGDLSVNTESEVSTTNPPAELPPVLGFLGVLIGRVIVQELIDPFVKVESAFAEEYKPGSATAHNNLPGLQGGAFDDYYHVTAADLEYFGTLPAQLAAKASLAQLEEETLLTSLLLR